MARVDASRLAICSRREMACCAMQGEDGGERASDGAGDGAGLAEPSLGFRQETDENGASSGVPVKVIR